MRWTSFFVLLGSLPSILAGPSLATPKLAAADGQHRSGSRNGRGGGGRIVQAAPKTHRLQARAEIVIRVDGSHIVSAANGAVLGVALTLQVNRWSSKFMSITEAGAQFAQQWQVSRDVARCVATKCYDARTRTMVSPGPDTLALFLEECGKENRQPVPDAPRRVYNGLTLIERLAAQILVAEGFLRDFPTWSPAVAKCVAAKLLPAEGEVPIPSEYDMPSWIDDCQRNAESAGGGQNNGRTGSTHFRLSSGSGSGRTGAATTPGNIIGAMFGQRRASFLQAVTPTAPPTMLADAAAADLAAAARRLAVSLSQAPASAKPLLGASFNPADTQTRKHLFAELRKTFGTAASSARSSGTPQPMFFGAPTFGVGHGGAGITVPLRGY